MTGNYHESVMTEEVIEALHVQKNCNYIDATLGTGGHAFEILKRGGKVLGIEMDPQMIKISQDRLKSLKNLKLVQGNFTRIDEIVGENKFLPISGIVFDLGVSNIHLKDGERGFSFENGEAELDMRLDPNSQEVKASDLLNILREDQLEDLFAIALDPGAAKWITGRVLHSRLLKPIKTVGDMLEIAKGLRTGKYGIREATLPFLALRIAVNSEIDNLKEALPKAYDLLEEGGRLVVISFHSREDKVVKEFVGSSRLIAPTLEEISKNPRARSAKMRIIVKK